MRLPHASGAVIDRRKLEEYCLSFDHPRGRHKARVFHSALGITAGGAAEFELRIREALEVEPFTEGHRDRFGRRYTMDFRWEREGMSAVIRTTWIIRSGEDFPRLTSCYVL
ncbi:MAG: DUF6883 domain-containing protein [Limisphaerales bacterium]